mgnify:CR=1 FL=1
MTLTTLLLSEWFAKFNSLYFCDTLPTPLFRLSKARTRFGYMKCVTSRKSWFSKPQRTFTIYISTYYDCSERDYQTVLLHEMIHYLICFLRLEDTSPHGVLFKKKADQINRCGWNITVSTSASHLKVSEQTRKRQRGRCLLLLVTTDKGQRFLSAVAAKYAFKIHHDIAHARGQITDEKWFVSDDQRFNTFSRVRSLRGKPVKSEEELQAFLSVMQPVDKKELCYVVMDLEGILEESQLRRANPIILSPQERRQDFFVPVATKGFPKRPQCQYFFLNLYLITATPYFFHQAPADAAITTDREQDDRQSNSRPNKRRSQHRRGCVRVCDASQERRKL